MLVPFHQAQPLCGASGLSGKNIILKFDRRKNNIAQNLLFSWTMPVQVSQFHAIFLFIPILTLFAPAGEMGFGSYGQILTIGIRIFDIVGGDKSRPMN